MNNLAEMHEGLLGFRYGYKTQLARRADVCRATVYKWLKGNLNDDELCNRLQEAHESIVEEYATESETAAA